MTPDFEGKRKTTLSSFRFHYFSFGKQLLPSPSLSPVILNFLKEKIVQQPIITIITIIAIITTLKKKADP